jgi:hypothetical protein
MVWRVAEHTGVVWCSAVVDVLIVGRDITASLSPYRLIGSSDLGIIHEHTFCSPAQ